MLGSGHPAGRKETKGTKMDEAPPRTPTSCKVLAGVLVVFAAAGMAPSLFVPATLVVLPLMVVATVGGVRVWRPPARLPWYLLAATAGAALLGAILSAPLPDGSVL